MSDERTERTARAFLRAMRSEQLRRDGTTTPRVPDLDAMNMADRISLLRAIAYALTVADQVPAQGVFTPKDVNQQ